jgi:tRNA U34 2-thiouridine synthase MnmA/TrmU
VTWVDGDPTAGEGAGHGREGVGLTAQSSAHGRPAPAVVSRAGEGLAVTFDSPQRRVAPGQTVALYDLLHPDEVVGSGIAR